MLKSPLTNSMAHITPEPLSHIYIIGPLVAILGGVVSYLQRLKKNPKLRFSFAELVGECVISGFAGFLTLLLCIHQDFSLELSAFLAGMAGHLGSRALFLLEQGVLNKLDTNKNEPK